MDELIDDHRRARAITRRLIGANEAYRAGDSAALDEIRIALLGLAELYPVHIAKEDRGFFKPCLEYFSDEERAGMLAEFEHFDQGLIHEKYRLVADTLESRFR